MPFLQTEHPVIAPLSFTKAYFGTLGILLLYLFNKGLLDREVRVDAIGKIQVSIARIWDRLRFSEDERQAVINDTQGLTPDVLVKLQKELDGLREMQKERIQVMRVAHSPPYPRLLTCFLQGLTREYRSHIRECFTQMRCSEADQKELFPNFFEEKYTEELLDQHETKLEEMQKRCVRVALALHSQTIRK